MTNTPATASPTRPANASKPRWLLLISAALALLIVVWLVVRWLTHSKPKPAAPPPIPVNAAAVKVGDIDVYLDELGTVTATYTVTVASRVAGELTQVRYREGQLVKKNELLAVIDPRPYEAAYVQAQGQLARDNALLANARIDLKRYQASYEAHAIPEQQLATQQALVDQDAGTVKLDEGNLAAAKVNVDYTRIVAPIAGRIGLRTVDPGNIVPANGTTGIATITQVQPITVIFTIAEDNLDEVADELHAGRTLEVDAFDRTQRKKIATGTLLTLDNLINTTSGTVRARAQFANEHNELFPNEFVNVRLRVKTLKGVNLVPGAALQRNNNVAYVYAIQPDGSVKSIDVKVVASDGNTSAVTGVEPGQQLVTDGFDKLQNGSKVTIKAPPAAAPKPAPAAAAAGGGTATG
jgi:multidrug efflux system membrane fusion protein